MHLRFLIAAAVAAILMSCATQRQIVYFQDVENGTVERIERADDIRLRPSDQIAIVVNSKDQQLAEMFNLPLVTYRVGNANTAVGGTRPSYSQQSMAYTVRDDGSIDFPILGRVEVEGLTREEVAAKIKGMLVEGGLLKDAVVTVEYMNLSVSVLGEVSKPGRINIDKERISIVDAISMAGDLTIYGCRDRVMVLRLEEDGQHTYMVDLRNNAELCESPVYYLQQGDVVYVAPNKMRSRQSTVNGNNVLSASFWLSLTSLLATITALFIR